MKLQIMDGEFAVCKLKGLSGVAPRGPFCSLTVTGEEISLVCPAEDAPPDCLKKEDGWACLKIAGVLDFSLVGILSRIAGILAESGISIFAVSTYNTDYILLKQKEIGRAATALREHGYGVESE